MLSVSHININPIIDTEHRSIIRQLIALGITPTYNKSADRAILAKAKAEINKKLEQKIEEHYSEQNFDEQNQQIKISLENMTGLSALSDLNKYLLNY